MRVAYGVLMLFVAAPSVVSAAPDLSTKSTVRGLTVVRDREKPAVFYFFPGKIEIASRDDGGPDLVFSVARYTGTVVHGDQGRRALRPTLFARVRLAEHDRNAVQAAARDLSSQHRINAVLRPIPVAKLEAQLIYAAVQDDGTGEDRILGTGFFEPAGAEGSSASMWKERDAFLLVDPATAELLENQLRSGSLGLTLAYSFYSRGWIAADDRGEITTTGDPDFAAALEEALTPAPADAGPRLSAIHADAVPIVIPEEFRASRIRRYDIDTTYPPDYPSLVAYCFDFRDGDRPDLFEKTIVIEAAGVAGGTTRYVATFGSNAPEVVAQTVRFPFGVDLRRPYRWRAEEILLSGETVRGPWRSSDSWTEIIDASGSIAGERPASDQPATPSPDR